MPHSSLKLIPGVDTQKTFALNEASISECDLIRFVPDRTLGGIVQKLGGWTKFINASLESEILALHAWADTNETSRISAGCEADVYVGNQTAGMNAISPYEYTIDIPVAFSTVALSNVVTITDTGSNISDFDAINILTPVSVGGIILSGYYNTKSSAPNSYTILSTDVFGNPVNAISTVTNGGSVVVYETTLDSLSVKVHLDDHKYTVGSTYTALVRTDVGGISIYGNYVVQTVFDADTFTISESVAADATESVPINDDLVRINYFIGQQAVIPRGGFGSGLFGDGGFGIGTYYTGGRKFTITAASCVGTVATLILNNNMIVPKNSVITITGVTPSGYNGTWTVTDSSEDSVSYAVPTTLGAGTAFGSLRIDVYQNSGWADWSLDNWGEDLIASPHMGAIYDWQPNNGADHLMVLPNSPMVNEGAFVAMPQRQIIAYGSTFTGIQDPLLIRWCDVGDNSSWLATVINQAGSYRIARGSAIVGAMQGPQQALIWTDIGLWTMQYVGPPYVYAFNEIGSGCGLVSRRAAGTLAGVVYWMGQSQFYKMAGGWPEVLPCPVWDVVFQNVSLENRQRIRCAPNSRFGEITWYFPTDDSDGQPSRYVKYNSLLNQWDFGNLTRTAWIDQSVFGPPIGAGPGNYIYQHETSNDADGEPMSSHFTTGMFALSEGDSKIFIDQIWPDMHFGEYSGPYNAEVSITFYVFDYPNSEPVEYGPYKMTANTQYITPRLRGRLVVISVYSDDIGSFWRLGNIRYRGQADGKY